ncbi:hypothetical protein ACFXK0_12925 [Nocardia sp. NPDC059177]|uniref:hypothetical protein n=1 Tax=Nocardia sp. NPDC059177 TaxID=3346759 RepID=UPI0036CEC27D
MTFYTVRGQQMVEVGIVYITDFARRGQKRGDLAPYDPRPVAELLARLAHSLMLTPTGGIDFDDEEQARSFVRSAIVPLLVHGISTPPPAKPKKQAAKKSTTSKTTAARPRKTAADKA